MIATEKVKSKKKSDFDERNNSLQVHHTFYYISLTFIARLQCETS